MKKILFLIHDLGPGGAEKVLVNLVNNMDQEKFQITVMSLFDEGINRQFLKPNICYKYVFKKMFPGNSHIMKLLTPRILHKLIIKDNYDIEVSYLEGPCARIISGCPNQKTKLVCWIHIEQYTRKRVASAFRNMRETIKCYNRFKKIVCVSQTVKKDFLSLVPIDVPVDVLYNTNDSEMIRILSKETIGDICIQKNEINLVCVGKLLVSKGIDRILRITKRLVEEKYLVHTYILGCGPEEVKLKHYVKENELRNRVTFLGYQTNPYKYVAKCDLFVCASYAEGFSTAATEALIVGTPVCTVEVSGMQEMLGENNEYGIITENNEEALFQGLRTLLDNPEILNHYRVKAAERGKLFSKENTVKAVEEMLNYD